MTFDPTKPASQDILATSQGDLLTNYGQQDTIFGVDHVAYSATQNNGKHKKTTLHYESNIPIPVPADNEIIQYPNSNPNGRINGNVIYGVSTDIANYLPFAICYLELLGGNAVNDLGNSVNIDIAASSWAGSTITLVFNTAATNANYQVFITPGSKVVTLSNLGTIRIMNQTANSFEIRGSHLTTNIEFYIFVFEI